MKKKIFIKKYYPNGQCGIKLRPCLGQSQLREKKITAACFWQLELYFEYIFYINKTNKQTNKVFI
jgi:hypothetical protein